MGYQLLSASPLTYFMRRDDSDLVVFCFANPDEAPIAEVLKRAQNALSQLAYVILVH